MTESTPTATRSSARTADTVQFLTFTLGNEEYAIPILQAQEIKGYTGLTPIPSAPSYVTGVMNLRGAVVPVYDLRKRFSMPAAEYTRFSVVVVVGVGSKVCGMVVDAVSEVLAVAESAIAPPPELGIGGDAAFVTGMFEAGGKLVAVLDVGRICGLDRMPAESAASSAA